MNIDWGQLFSLTLAAFHPLNLNIPWKQHLIFFSKYFLHTSNNSRAFFFSAGEMLWLLIVWSQRWLSLFHNLNHITVGEPHRISAGRDAAGFFFYFSIFFLAFFLFGCWWLVILRVEELPLSAELTVPALLGVRRRIYEPPMILVWSSRWSDLNGSSLECYGHQVGRSEISLIDYSD